MVRRQQAFGRRGGVVMEGRDIGSVVFPLATAKIFLRATLAARVTRRVRQFRQRGRDVDPDAVHRDLAARDRFDSERDTSPLAISPDAIVVDSSDLDLARQNEACARACLLNPALDRELDDDLDRALADLPWHYRLAYATFGALARFYGLRQVGNVGRALPRGVIGAANHTSYWDPPLLGSTLHRHPVHTLAKEELFRPAWLMGRFFNWLDAIPIRRRGYDEAAFAAAKSALDRGAVLLIFPEGTRRPVGAPGPVRNGLGILVQATRAPVIPVFIRGSHGRSPGGSARSPLEIRWGPVIRFHALDELLAGFDGKEVNRRIGELCAAAWRELQERSYAERPRTAYEREEGTRQAARFARKHEQLFGPAD
jgi:1-acyl-sn-glycerol-3-phosphate acyltransferase